MNPFITQIEDRIDIRRGTNDNTIAIKTAVDDNNKSSENNANPKIPNNDYVTVLLTLFKCKIKDRPKLRLYLESLFYYSYLL